MRSGQGPNCPHHRLLLGPWALYTLWVVREAYNEGLQCRAKGSNLGCSVVIYAQVDPTTQISITVSHLLLVSFFKIIDEGIAKACNQGFQIIHMKFQQKKSVTDRRAIRQTNSQTIHKIVPMGHFALLVKQKVSFH